MTLRLPALVLLLVGMLSGCATPVPPSGGPVDRSPPRILSAEPAAGSVHVTGQTVRIEFADWMDENSLQRALTITPEPDVRPTVRWRRRTAEITFAEPFRPNTTYILTLDRNVRTFRGGTLEQPITIAFATGDRIDEGVLSGRVVEPRRGEAVQGIDIYAYRSPTGTADAPPLALLPERPDYRTQTGTDGTFRLGHVAEGPYLVIALQDANRNRRVDPGEAFAVPPHPWIVADTVGAPPERPWIITVGDTTAPELNRVRTLSERHLELRYTEPVVLPTRDPALYSLTPVAGGTAPSIAQVFARDSDRRFVYLTLSSGITAGRYAITAAPVADTLGNVATAATLEFDAAPAPDTLRQQFLGFVPDTTRFETGVAELLHWQRPGFRLHMPVPTGTLENAVTVADTLGAARRFSVQSADGTTIRLDLEPELREGEVIDVRVTLEGIAAEQRFRRLAETEIGEITGTLVADETAGPFTVELTARGEGEFVHQIMLDEAGPFIIEGLPEGEYSLRAFVGTVRWDGGTIAPYRAPAPIRWVPQVVSVRPRWETALPEAISFDDPPQVPPAEPVEPPDETEPEDIEPEDPDDDA